PGYFSAREEDLDPLEMDVDYFIPHARKKQRTSISLHQGPKFAALWDPSRRENWPLPDEIEKDQQHQQEEKKKDLERERVEDELRGLQSPAFKLPPSARKEPNLVDFVEQDTPIKAGEKDTRDFMVSSNPPASPLKGPNDFQLSVSKPLPSPSKNGISEPTFAVSKPPSSPTKPADKPSEMKSQFPSRTGGIDLFDLKK